MVDKWRSPPEDSIISPSLQMSGQWRKFARFWEESYLLLTRVNQREGTSFVLEFQWMWPVLCAVDDWFQLDKRSRSGLASNMRDYQTYATGAAALIMTIRITKFGWIAKAHLLRSISNLGQVSGWLRSLTLTNKSS